MNAREWIEAYAQRLGIEPPSSAEWSALLDLAAEAAHSSERVAAPIACWVAAKAGLDPGRALTEAEQLGTDG